jgi:hypothetical protein
MRQEPWGDFDEKTKGNTSCEIVPINAPQFRSTAATARQIYGSIHLQS